MINICVPNKYVTRRSEKDKVAGLFLKEVSAALSGEGSVNKSRV